MKNVEGSLWAEKSVASSDITEHSNELVKLFFEDPNDKTKAGKKGGAGTDSAGGKKPKVVQLLDLKRANNIAITLSRFKLSNAEIKQAILKLDSTTLTFDHLQMLLTLLPTSDEMKMLKAYKGDHDKLGVSERFLLTMARIPKVEARVQGFIFKLEFNSRKDELKDKVTLMASTAKKVMDSTKLKGILEITLALGNFMNSGHSLGNAQGCSIESLLMLSGIRAGTNKKITLMHYLSALVATKEPHLLDFAHDLRGCKEAAAMAVGALRQEMAQLLQCGDELSKTLSEIAMPREGKKELDGSTSTFIQIMTEFHEGARVDLEELQAKLTVMDTRFQALATYFGEDTKNFNPNDFFAHVNSFVEQFEKSLAEMRQFQKEKPKSSDGKEESMMGLFT